jgi:hypothetical protein
MSRAVVALSGGSTTADLRHLLLALTDLQREAVTGRAFAATSC